MRRYGVEAQECRMNAAKTKNPTERPGLLQFAQLCEILANSIEASLADESASN